ncbi:alkaline phosphatase family protein [Saccharopolyspora shandongensis]|uniref:alkaline phosphatase family protein n=1 Tax=Saccharopolyspora shandongensis TaxID=418495 RepID=UPI003438EDC5
MRLRRALACAVAAAAAITLAVTPTPAIGHGAAGPRADHVVLVVWDGFDSEYRHRVATPNLDALARHGAITDSTGVMQTITSPSMASLATGAFPERHLNTAYVYDAATNVATGQSRAMAAETLAQSLGAQGRTVASIQWFILQNYGTTYGDPKALYTQPGGTCDKRVDQFTDLMAGRPVISNGTPVTVPEIPDFTAVYCNDLDALGHQVGADDPQLAVQMAEMDRQLGRIVQATKDAGTYGRTAFLIVGDHGMTTFDKAFGNDVLAAIAEAGFKGEFLGSGASPAADTDVAIVVGGNGSLHMRGAAADPGAIARIRANIEKLPQVRAVFGKPEQRMMRMSPAIGELLVEPKPGWTVDPNPPAAPAGRHGSTTELQTTFLIAGAGVRPNARVVPSHVDVAPTISELLGVPAPTGAHGRVLREALR